MKTSWNSPRSKVNGLKNASYATVLLALLISSGCGGRGPAYRTVPVKGVLTCQGKPIAQVQVLFSPKAEHGREEKAPGRAAMARTDENGRFELSTYGLHDGAVIGKHTVTFIVLDDPRAPVPEESKKNAAPCLPLSLEIEVTPKMEEVQLRFGE